MGTLPQPAYVDEGLFFLRADYVFVILFWDMDCIL